MRDELDQLVALSNRLGEPARDYVILGEGNTSARAPGGTFWVKASGFELRTVGAEGFVAVELDRALALMDAGERSDEDETEALLSCCVSGRHGPRPSVETIMHAVCLSVPGVNVVGHTHPTAVNALTCCKDFETWVSGRLFPDEIVVCGVAPCVVPYTDPGVALARAVQRRMTEYAHRHGERARVVLIQNHGLVALGSSARDVENITAMAVKSARILLGTLAAGGPRFLSEAHVTRISTRADEHYRRKIIGGGKG